MRTVDLHGWDLAPDEARALQRELRERLTFEDAVRLADVRVVAGVDCAYLRPGAETLACAVAAALSFPALEVLETRVVFRPITFPYVPGLLAFREVPAMLGSLRELRAEPDVVLVDAQGYAHPRRMGAASHLGLLIDRPTIGCAKSRLVGRYEEPARALGAQSPLTDRGEVIGAVVRTRPTTSPLFVSTGNRISLPTAVQVVLACSRGRSIMPEPTRVADAITRQETKRRRLAAAQANGS
jgi:deoxyribonuclease V